MIKALFFSLLLIFISCKQKFFRNSSSSMEGTIKVGETFPVKQTKTFKQNDIVVFDYLGRDYNSPPDEETGNFKLKQEKRTFRLIGTSGDVVEIRRGEVYVNNMHLSLPPLAKTEYQIDSRVPIHEFSEKEIETHQSQNADTITYLISLTRDEVEHYMQRKQDIIDIRKFYPIDLFDTLIARASSEGNWSLDNYGPLKIPSPGDSIEVNEVSLRLYHNIPEIHAGLNIVKEKLYFLMGDNRHNAEDSRFIGLISHSKMYGIVLK